MNPPSPSAPAITIITKPLCWKLKCFYSSLSLMRVSSSTPKSLTEGKQHTFWLICQPYKVTCKEAQYKCIIYGCKYLANNMTGSIKRCLVSEFDIFLFFQKSNSTYSLMLCIIIQTLCVYTQVFCDFVRRIILLCLLWNRNRRLLIEPFKSKIIMGLKLKVLLPGMVPFPYAQKTRFYFNLARGPFFPALEIILAEYLKYENAKIRYCVSGLINTYTVHLSIQ
jgi:hypothetical protein